MTLYLSPLASLPQLFSDAGIPLSGGLLWTFAAGSATPTPTWTDSTGLTPNANPIVLNSAGRLQNVSIWQQDGDTVTFQWDQARPGSKPVLAHRDRVVLFRPPHATTPLLTADDLIEAIERRYDRT